MRKVIHRYIETSKQEAYIEFMKNFDYELLERFIDKDMTDLHFIKYNDKPYSKKLNQLERMYFSYESFPLKYIIGITIFGIALVTTFLVLRFTLGSNFDYVFWFLCLLLPAILLILCGVGIFVYKYFKMFKDPEKAKKEQQNILLQIKKIKEENNNA